MVKTHVQQKARLGKSVGGKVVGGLGTGEEEVR